MTGGWAHPRQHPGTFTRSLRDDERRDLDRDMTVKTLAELRLCEGVDPA
jgi:hypothetical protein